MVCKVLPEEFNYQQSKCVYLFLQVNGLGFTYGSLSSNHVRRPSRRVEVSPPQTPALPHFNYTTPRYGSYGAHTFTETSHSPTVGTQLDHKFGSDSFRRYAFSEVPRDTHLHRSTSTYRGYRQKTLRQTTGPQPVFANPALEQNGERGSPWSQNQTAVKHEKRTLQRQNDKVLGAIQLDDGLRRNGQRLRRINSFPASVISMEVDRGRQVEVHLPTQQTQTQNVMSL